MSVSLTRLGPADRDLFEAAYRLLEAEFAHKGELERKDVLARFLEDDRYHCVVARDASGSLAGVRDCHVRIDASRALATIYLAHVLVVPEHRQRGLGRIFRDYAQTLLQSIPSPERILVAEMEPDNPILSTYTGDGFRMLDPRVIDYRQPDFSGKGSPIPLRLLVRWLSHESASALPNVLTGGIFAALYSIFSAHCDASHLENVPVSTDVPFLLS